MASAKLLGNQAYLPLAQLDGAKATATAAGRAGNSPACPPPTVHGVVFDILLIGVLVGLGTARNDVGAGQPAVQVDVAAALGAERFGGIIRRLAADRALPGGPLAGSALFG